MTVSTTSNRKVYTGDGTSDTFAYDFKIFVDTDLVVKLDGVTKTLTTDYTVTGAGNPAGGNVVFVTPPATSVQVLILRTLPLTQATDYQENDGFQAESHEAGLDRVVMIAQQFEELLGRSITIPDTSTASDIVIPDPALTANKSKLLRIAPTGPGIDVVDPGFTSDGVVTTKGDIIQGGTGGVAERLAVGATDDFITVASGKLAYETLSNRIKKLGALQHGQCYLTLSGANLLLSRQNGQYIMVKTGSVWELRSIPASGPTLAPTGLTPGTLYFIYLFDSSGTLTLEASTTGHSTDASTGVEIKTGDATRTLVGMGMPGSGPIWENSPAVRRVLSYFNRRGLSGAARFTASRTTASGTFVELNSEIRNNFLTWADEALIVSAQGAFVINSGSEAAYVSIGIDGTSAEDIMNTGSFASTAPDVQELPFGLTLVKRGLTEGSHYVTLLGRNSAATNTVTFEGGGNAVGCTVTSQIKG